MIFATRHSAAVPRRAFTLLEILIAVVTFSVVLAAINGVFYGALRLRNKTVQAFDAAVPLQHTLAVMRRDLSNLAPPGGTLLGNLQTTASSLTGAGNDGAANTSTSGRSGMAMSVVSQPGQSSPEFFTTGGLIDETSPWSDAQRVAYFLVPSTNGSLGRDLFRSVTRNLLPSIQEEPTQEPLMSGVESLYFQYYDGTQWNDTWDSTTQQASRLPAAIRVQIVLATEQRGRSMPPPIELIVPILVYGGTNQVAGGGQ